MSANLFAFTKAIHLGVFVGVITVGSWVASQTTSEEAKQFPPGNVPSHSEFQLNCTPRIDMEVPGDRESSFTAESPEQSKAAKSTDQQPANVADAATPCIKSSATCCGNQDQSPRSADLEFLTQASHDLSVAGIDAAAGIACQNGGCSNEACSSNCIQTLGQAAETGCRLFNQLTGTTSKATHSANAATLNSEERTDAHAHVVTVSDEQAVSPRVEEPALLTQPVRQPASETVQILRPTSPTEKSPAAKCEPADIAGSTCDTNAANCPTLADPTSTCHLRNRKTNESVATLSIASTNTESLTEEEIAASSGGGSSLDDSHLTPMVRVSQNEYTQAWQVEAKNIEMATLLLQLNEHCDFDIVCGDDVNGTVSAQVSAHSMDELLHRLVVPFGLKLRRDGPTMIVGSITQPRLAAPALAVNVQQEVANGELNRLPPVADESKIEPASLVRRAAAVEIDEAEMRIAAMAKLSIAQGNTSAAQAMINQAISQRPQSAFLHRILGEAYAFQSDLENSAAALERSVKLNKYDPLTSQIFSEVLARMGQERRAKHYAQLSKDVASGLMSP